MKALLTQTALVPKTNKFYGAYVFLPQAKKITINIKLLVLAIGKEYTSYFPYFQIDDKLPSTRK